MEHTCDTRVRILQFITVYREEWGFGPSVREIAKAIGVSSPSTVAQHLDWLEDHGMIIRTKSKFRSLIATQKELPIPVVPS